MKGPCGHALDRLVAQMGRDANGRRMEWWWCEECHLRNQIGERGYLPPMKKVRR